MAEESKEEKSEQIVEKKVEKAKPGPIDYIGVVLICALVIFVITAIHVQFISGSQDNEVATEESQP